MFQCFVTSQEDRLFRLGVFQKNGIGDNGGLASLACGWISMVYEKGVDMFYNWSLQESLGNTPIGALPYVMTGVRRLRSSSITK